MFIFNMRKLFIYTYGYKDSIIAELGGIYFQGESGNDWLDTGQ